MSQIKITQGNDFVLELICMKQVDTETKNAFDISACTNVSLSLYCETHEEYVPINNWSLAEGTTNVIRANVEGSSLHAQAKYGLVITGVDENGENFKTRIRGRNFIYVVGSISDVSANDFITNPLTIQVTMNIQGELKPVVFDDLATVEVVDEKIAAAIESIDFSDYATKNELNQTNEALSAETRTRSTADQALQSAVEAVGTNLSSNYYTKTQVDDIVSSITGTGGDVTKEYVDNAVSGAVDDAADYTDEQISTITEKYLSVSKYKDIPLTFYNPGSEAVTLYFGNLGANPETLDWNQTEGNITEFSMVVGETRYLKTADQEKTQREDFYLGVEIPAGETAVVRGIMGSTRGALSFASSGELEVKGNLCSLYNEDFIYSNYYANGFDYMFMHVEDPIYEGAEVLKVKDFSKVYLDYTNYTDEEWAWSYNILHKMFYNNEWIERGPILVNYNMHYTNNQPIRETFNGCRNLVEVTDYSLNTLHDWNFIFNYIDVGEPFEGYKCLTDGLTVNLPLGSAENNKSYYEDLRNARPDINMTINYNKDYKAPYTSNGLIIKGLNKQIGDIGSSVGNIQSTVDDLTNKTNDLLKNTDIDLYTNVDPFSITALDGEQHVYYYQCLSNVSPDELQNKNPITDKDYIEYCILSKTEYEVDAIDWESITWTRLTPQDGVEYNGEYYNHAILPLDITLQENERCYFRMRNSLDGSYNHHGYPWGGDKFDGEGGLFSVEGNVMSLMYAEDFIGKTFPDNNFDFLMFKGLFYHFILLSQAENLFIPVLDGGNQILMQMFDRCYSLDTGPYCIALIYGGYEGMTDMYRNCGSLTKAYYLATNSRPNDTMFYIDDDEDGGPDGHPNRDNNGRIATEGTIYINKNRTWDLEREAWCPENWTIVEIEPEKNFVNHFELKTYATQEFVNESVSGLATQTYVDNAVSGLASTIYVDDAIAAITGPDLSQYATQTFVNEAVSGLATEAYVDAAVSGAGGGVSQQYVDDAVSGCLVDAKSYTDDTIDAKVPVPYEEQYLTIETIPNDNATRSLYFSDVNNIDFYYSTDLITWKKAKNYSRAIFSSKIYFKGYLKNNSVIYCYDETIIDKIKIYGNIGSIILGDDFKNNNESLWDSNNNNLNSPLKYFFSAFKDKTIDAENLILINPKYKNSNRGNLYNGLFTNFTNLTKAKISYNFNVTANYESIINNIFDGCSSLNTIISNTNTRSNYPWGNGLPSSGTYINLTVHAQNIFPPTGWTILPKKEYEYSRKYEISNELKPLLYNIEAVSAANEEITITLNTNEYNKVYLVDYNATTPEYVTGDTTITLTGTADYNVSILKFKTDANFTSLTLTNQTSATLKWIGDDFTTLEANKEYEVMFEYTNGFELIVSWAEVSAAS